MGAVGAARGAALMLSLLMMAPSTLGTYPWELPMQHAETANGPGWSSYRVHDLDEPLWIAVEAHGGVERILGIHVVDAQDRVILRAEARSWGNLYEFRIDDGSGNPRVVRPQAQGLGAGLTWAIADCGGWGMITAMPEGTALGLEVDCEETRTIGVLVWAVGDAVRAREASLHAEGPLVLDALRGEGGVFLRTEDFGAPAASARAEGFLVGGTAAVALGGERAFAIERAFHGSFGPARDFGTLLMETMEMAYASPTREDACPCVFAGAALDPGAWTFRLAGAALTEDDIRLAGVDARYPPA